MNFSHLNFGNNFLSMQQFSTATKVVENVQQNVAFIPAPSTQHYHNHSNQLSFPNGVQVTTAVIQQQHHYQDTLSRPMNQNVTSHSANTTSTTSTAAQTQWPEVVNRISNETIKVNTGLPNFLPPAHGNHITQTIQRPSRTVVMQSVSTMTEVDYSATLGSKNSLKYTISDESDESSKSSTIDNQQFQGSSCSNSCNKIHLKSNASAMTEYLNRLQPSSIPPMILDFLKRQNIQVSLNKVDKIPCNKDSEDTIKKKPEIRVSTALDGSLLYCCSECHMAYPIKELLERHLSVHKPERKFECNVCGVCLKRKEHLDQHKRGHSEERPFVCEICCKGFKRNEHLRRHIVIHSGDKSHVCIQCGKAFSRKDHLNKHLQTHVGKQVKGEMNESSSPILLIQTQSPHKHGHP